MVPLNVTTGEALLMTSAGFGSLVTLAGVAGICIALNYCGRQAQEKDGNSGH